MPLDQVVCPNCNTNAEYKISGPQAKNPGRLYWTCPQCPNPKDGKGSLFIKFEDEKKEVPKQPPLKRQKTEPLIPKVQEHIPQWAKIQNEKTDILLSKLDRLLLHVEGQELPEEPWESSQLPTPNYIS